MTGKDFWTAFAPVLGLLIVFVIAFLAVYKKELIYHVAPTIDMVSSSEIVTDQSEVPITGVVHNTSDLTVNGEPVAVSGDGGFSITVPVNIGENDVTIVAGGESGAKAVVKVTREDVSKSVTPAPTSVTTSGNNLATSGPAENVAGAFGLAALMISIYVYRRSLAQNTLQTPKKSL